MRTAEILIALFFAVLFCDGLTAEQEPSTAVAQKPGGGRFWTMSQLDTVMNHMWLWLDRSFKEAVPESTLARKGTDDLPILRKFPSVKYPKEALKRRVQADVRVRVLIDAKGKVRGAFVQMDSGHDSLGFEETALEAAKQCTWQAADGKTWSGAKWVTELHQFRLRQSDSKQYGEFTWWSLDEEKEESLALPPLLTTAEVKDTDGSDGFLSSPQVVSVVQPQYPEQAMRQGEEAEIWVKLLINQSGKVAHSEIIMKTCEPQFGFEKSALDASLQGLWKPPLVNGKPVPAWVSYSILYQLGIH